jgi:hypothetical protein
MACTPSYITIRQSSPAFATPRPQTQQFTVHCMQKQRTPPLTQRASRHPPPLSSRYVHPRRSPKPKPTQTLHPPQIPHYSTPSLSLSPPTHPPSMRIRRRPQRQSLSSLLPSDPPAPQPSPNVSPRDRHHHLELHPGGKKEEELHPNAATTADLGDEAVRRAALLPLLPQVRAHARFLDPNLLFLFREEEIC